MNHFTKPLFLVLGWISVALGIVGIIIPVLPTTPFLIVAVWAFSRSSPELAARIRGHKAMGPYILAWEAHGVIPPKAKVFAVIAMACSFGFIGFFARPPQWLLAVTAITLLAVAAYILTRPNHPPPN